MKTLHRVLGRARDEAGVALVALGYVVMTDECAVEVVEAVAETLGESLGGASRPNLAAIPTIPHDAG